MKIMKKFYLERDRIGRADSNPTIKKSDSDQTLTSSDKEDGGMYHMVDPALMDSLYCDDEQFITGLSFELYAILRNFFFPDR